MDNKVSVGILGGGAIGLLYAALLQHASITIYTHTTEQAESINQEGLLLESSERHKRSFPIAMPSQDMLNEQPNILFIALKQHQLEPVLPLIQSLPGHIAVCFLSNGIGHLKFLKDLSAQTIIVSTSEHGAMKEGMNKVNWGGSGRTNYSYYRYGENYAELESFFTRQIEFPFVKSQDYKQMLYDKLIINCVINPLTAVFRIRNGELIHHEDYFRILQTLLLEIEPILGLSKQLAAVKRVCLCTAPNYSSMATDVLQHRLTEADGIIKPVLDMAKKQGQLAPLLHLLYQQIKIIEGMY